MSAPAETRRIVCTVCGRRSVARRLCRAHYQAAWKAGQLGRHEPLPPRVSDPKICPPEHRHAGSLVCYNLHQCRCASCVAHRGETDLLRAKLKAYGRYDSGLVDAGPAREHLLMLGEFGIGYKRVAQLAGIGTTPVRNLIWGRQDPGPRKGELVKRVKRETAEAILSVQPVLELLGSRMTVPARPYVRRLQALCAVGWSQRAIARELGITGANFTILRRWEDARRRHRTAEVRISAGHARAIIALYDAWSTRTPPERTHHERVAVSRCRNYAAARGWATPMDWAAYDDDFDRAVPPRRSVREAA